MPSDLIDAKADGGGSGGRKADFHPDLATIRAMSTVLPGALPLAVNGVRVAASIRPRKFVIAGGDDTPVTMPRTAFQVIYPDCSVMLDSGLDKATHDSFSPDKPEPYYADEFATLQRALDQARRQESFEEQCQNHNHDGPADKFGERKLPAHQNDHDDAELDDQIGRSELKRDRGGEIRAFAKDGTRQSHRRI